MKPNPTLAALVAASIAAAAPALPGSPAAVPAELVALAAKAQITAPIQAWCPLETEAGRPGGYALAVPSPTGGGLYLALGLDARSIELAAFSGAADLACYTPAAARELHHTIAASVTVQGRIQPAGPSTVVCGFVAQTSAVCWQYSVRLRMFVKVGQWTT